jgi:hypothetical protein
MVRRSDDNKIKKSARQVLNDADVTYVSDTDAQDLKSLIDRIRSVVEKGMSSAVA